jgi:hypothetical protein
MIASIGLLTRKGIDNFYPIFKDMENRFNNSYKDPFPTLPFPNKPVGDKSEDEYRRRLVEVWFTSPQGLTKFVTSLE